MRKVTMTPKLFYPHFFRSSIHVSVVATARTLESIADLRDKGIKTLVLLSCPVVAVVSATILTG